MRFTSAVAARPPASSACALKRATSTPDRNLLKPYMMGKRLVSSPMSVTLSIPALTIAGAAYVRDVRVR